MRKITAIGIIFCLLMTFVSAIDFTSTILDAGQAYMNPSNVFDVNGIGYMFWSNGTDLIYTTTQDNTKRTTLFTAPQQLGNIQSEVDPTTNIIHLVFSVYDGTYKYYYMNLRDGVAIDLNINYYENAPAIDADKGKVYIVLVGALPQQDEDLVLLTSTDYQNFDATWLQKPSVQLHPSIEVIDNTIHIVYWSWVDGVQDGVGQYKVRYTNSDSNFEDEKIIAQSGQSYNPVIKKDTNNNLFVALKDAGDSGLGFDGGYIYLYNISGDSYEKITPEIITFMQDRNLGLTVDKSNIKHVVWSELFDGGNQVSIKYANSLDFVKSTVQDVSYETQLGYPSISSFNNQLLILANIHSIASYEETQPPPSQCNCSNLQTQIDSLKTQITEINNSLNSRIGVIEQVIDWMHQFNLFNQFWIWTTSPKECFLEEKKCEGSDRYTCVDYAWNNKETCTYGCTNGICNPPPKDNCLTKLSDYYCSWGYSVEKNYYNCKSGQGTSTSCNTGQCRYYDYWKYCSKGCNNSTGKCNA